MDFIPTVGGPAHRDQVVIRKTDVRCLSVWRVTNVAMHNGTNDAYHKLLLNPRHWALSGRGATQVHPVPKTQKGYTSTETAAPRAVLRSCGGRAARRHATCRRVLSRRTEAPSVQKRSTAGSSPAGTYTVAPGEESNWPELTWSSFGARSLRRHRGLAVR